MSCGFWCLRDNILSEYLTWNLRRWSGPLTSVQTVEDLFTGDPSVVCREKQWTHLHRRVEPSNPSIHPAWTNTGVKTCEDFFTSKSCSESSQLFGFTCCWWLDFKVDRGGADLSPPSASASHLFSHFYSCSGSQTQEQRKLWWGLQPQLFSLTSPQRSNCHVRDRISGFRQPRLLRCEFKISSRMSSSKDVETFSFLSQTCQFSPWFKNELCASAFGEMSAVSALFKCSFFFNYYFHFWNHVIYPSHETPVVTFDRGGSRAAAVLHQS